MRARISAILITLFLVVSGSVVAAAAPNGGDTTVGEVTTQQVQVVTTPQADPQSGGLSPLVAVCEFPINVTNVSEQDKTVTSSSPRLYASTVWTNLECGALTVSVPRGKQAGVVIRTDAEVTCTGPTPDTTEWCQGRALISGVEGFPRAPEPDSFSWAHSDPDVGAWEGNVFTRSLPVRCPISSTTQLPCLFGVQVQVRNHAPNHTLRVDDSHVEAHLIYS